MRGIDFTGIALLAAIAAAGLIAYAVWKNGPAAIAKIKDAGAAALDAVNPASSGNVAARAVDATVSTVAGRDTTLGGVIFDWFNPDPMALMQQKTDAVLAARAMPPDSLPPFPY